MIQPIYPYPDRAEQWPQWTQNYEYTVKTSVRQSPSGYGKKVQNSNMNRFTTRVPVEKIFTGRLADEKLEYFESFVRTVLVNGQDKFKDYIVDGTGENLETVRILGGKYKVASDGISHRVTCELEIFRNVA